MTIFGRQPARWIGLIVTLILGALATLTGEGLISEALNGQITDLVNAAAELLTLVAPWIAGELIARGVTPVAAPRLPVGTVVRAEGTDSTTTIRG